MQPELNPEPEAFSDYVLLNRSPRDPQQKLIKRVVALEGDTVRTLGYRERLVTVPRGHFWLEGTTTPTRWTATRFGPVRPGPARGQGLAPRLAPQPLGAPRGARARGPPAPQDGLRGWGTALIGNAIIVIFIGVRPLRFG
ncbi:hypothetical protein HPB48_023391 [Haemaphysalis longicornis]|uniref:Mitochondrial inner membrane protease subunit 2 n=1 Tax=Haemaphysalis longicornis TaxID=44386 RepID=A0A9J6H804_HAELO|nr:hypothetical protein HPB48_023391 [Haemaphysalis longicornis]